MSEKSLEWKELAIKYSSLASKYHDAICETLDLRRRIVECEKALKSYQRSGDLIEANKLSWEYFSKYRDIS